MVVAYVRDKGFSSPVWSEPARALSPPVLFLILVFILAVFGALIVNFYQNNIILLIFVLMMVAIVVLAAFGRFIDHKVYSLAIAIIALGSLYQSTLIAPYLTGFDIHFEYYFEQRMIEDGYWDAMGIYGYNWVLSIVMLAPIYSLILNIDGAWVFKIIYPFVFSLVPLALFHIFRQQISDKKAFLAAFFFIAVPVFSLELISLARQQIAEFFFALFIVMMVDRKLRHSQRAVLAVVFALSIVVSHYSLSTICLLYFGLGWLLLLVIRYDWGRGIWRKLVRKAGGQSNSLTSPNAFPLKTIGIIMAIFIIGFFAYYGWVGQGQFVRYIRTSFLGQMGIATSGVVEILPSIPAASGEPTTGEPTTSRELPIFFILSDREPLIQTAFGLDFPLVSPQGKGFRVFQYITQLLIIIGFIRLILRSRKLRFAAEYIAFTVVSALILAVCVFLPGFSASINATRFYHIALFLLAPLYILGGEAIWLGLRALRYKARPVATTEENNKAFVKFVTLAVLIPYFLFTSGFIFEVTKNEVIDTFDSPYSIALSSHRVDVAGVFNWQDGAGVDWLMHVTGDEDIIYTDLHGWLLLGYENRPFGPVSGVLGLQWNWSQIPEEDYQASYIYFRTWNMDHQEVTYHTGTPGCRGKAGFSEAGVDELLKIKNRIYNNGGAQVLAPNQ